MFIDRDGDLFAIIIGYLRDGSQFPLPTSNNEYQLDRIEHEAKFYRLNHLVQLIERRRTYDQLEFTNTDGKKKRISKKYQSTSNTRPAIGKPSNFM